VNPAGNWNPAPNLNNFNPNPSFFQQAPQPNVHDWSSSNWNNASLQQQYSGSVGQTIPFAQQMYRGGQPFTNNGPPQSFSNNGNFM